MGPKDLWTLDSSIRMVEIIFSPDSQHCHAIASLPSGLHPLHGFFYPGGMLRPFSTAPV